MIRDNVELEARLIDDLLDITRIAHGKLHLNREQVDVHAVIRRALETCRDEIRRRRVPISALDLAAAEASRRGGPRAVATGLLEPDQERGEVHSRRRGDLDPIAQ